MMSQEPLRLLLVGAPNIGKSVIFNQLTGRQVYVANYPGATVSYHSAPLEDMPFAAQLIDVPGIYTLDACNEAEAVALNLLTGRDIQAASSHCDSDTQEAHLSSAPPAGVIVVLDACNLESSLYLLHQVETLGLPMLVLINRLDLAQERGLNIDLKTLASTLKAPLLPCIAIQSSSFIPVREALSDWIQELSFSAPQPPAASEARDMTAQGWRWASEVAKKVSQPALQMTSREVWGERLSRPWPGLLFALLILAACFGLVVGLGMGLRQQVLLPIVRGQLLPWISLGVEAVVPPGFWRNIIIGDFGFLVKGIEWPFTLVLPYVFSFYLTLGLLEDSGYLARLASLIDGVLKRIGISGVGIIPLLIGFGCGIPAIMASRSLSSYKQRLIVTFMVCISVPCIAQTGAFIAMFAEQSAWLVLAMIAFVLIFLTLTGQILARLLPGELPPTLIEIPDLLVPQWSSLAAKLWLRVRGFLKEGAIPMFYIIGVAAILYESGIMLVFSNLMSPLVVNWLNLPAEAATPLILGIMRRELTVLPLLELSLTSVQIFTAGVVALLYVPCVAIVATVAREYSLRLALGIVLLTLILAFGIGGLVAQTLGYLGF